MGRKASQEDLTGKRCGMLTVIEKTQEKRKRCTLWRCRCDCGKEILLEAYKINGEKVQSCGCQRWEKRKKDIAGQRFGKLTAIRQLEEKRGSNYLWLCRCDCGREIKTTANALLSGNTKSCGCGRAESMRRTLAQHGTVAEHVHLIDGTCVEKLRQQKLQKNNTSGYTGVQARGDKWIAIITFKGKVYYLGSYRKLEDAVRVRRQAEERLFGEFLNWYQDTH